MAVRKAATSLVLIFLVALGARMAFAWSQLRKMPAQAAGIVPFQNETGNVALALAEGKGFSNVFRTETGPTAWLAPVYPVIVAAIFRIFGIFTSGAFFAAVLFNILCSAAACVPIYLVGKRVWGLGVAAAGAWFWAVFPNGILIPFEWIWDTSLAAFLGAAILWATLEIAESEKALDWCGYGGLWGLALLTNPALGMLLPFLLGWAAWRARGVSGERWKRAGLAVAATVLCCLPWTARNYVVFHRLIPLRSNLAFELWSGNNEVFDADARGGRRVMTRREEVERYAKLGETAYMREKGGLAGAFIRTHPGLEVKLTERRFLNFWIGTDAPVKNFVESGSSLIRLILTANILSALGAFGGVLALFWRRKKGQRVTQRRRERRDIEQKDKETSEMLENNFGGAWVALAAYPVIFPLLYYVTHAYLRLRHPIDPVVMLLTAMALARLSETVRKAFAGSGGKSAAA